MRLHDKSELVIVENKAYMFLYPLLGFKHMSTEPLQCYLFKWNDDSNYRLHLLYYNREDTQFVNFLNSFVFKHDYYLSHIVIKEYIVITFDMTEKKDTYDAIVKSSFSKIEITDKLRLDAFYRDNKVKNVIDSYLVPHKYKYIYSKEFNTAVEIFPEELCSKTDIKKETLRLEQLQ